MKVKLSFFAVLLFLLYSFSGPFSVSAQEFSGKISESAVVIGTTNDAETLFINSIKINEFNPRHFAFLKKRDGLMYVNIDGTEGGGVENVAVGTPFFNLDGSRYAYIAFREKKSFVVTNGNEQPEFDGIDRPFFSPDGQRLVYRAKIGDRQALVEDGRIIAKFDGVKGYPVFSPDSKHLAFFGVNGKKVQIVLNGKIIMKNLENAKDITFSPNSSHLAFALKKNQNWYIAKDKKISKIGYENIQDLRFSPDSRRFVFAAQNRKKLFYVENGVEMSSFLTVGNFVFSPDSKRFAYAAMKGDGWRVILDGSEGPGLEKIAFLTFSPDSSRFAYSGFTKQKKGVMFEENKPTFTFDSVGQPLFSPDSRHLAFQARTGKIMRICFDGKLGDPYQLIQHPMFSPNSESFAYTAIKSKKMVVVRNGKPGSLFVEVGRPWFSPDGIYMAYPAKVEEKKWHLVLDETPGEKFFNGFLKNAPIVLDETSCRAFTLDFNDGNKVIFYKYELRFE